MSELRMPTDNVSVARLRELFTYDPDVGELRWKVTRGKARPGKLAGFVQTGRKVDMWRHRVVCVEGRIYTAQRIIWAMVTGEWPAIPLHHINGNRQDNRIANLTYKPSEHRNVLAGRRSEVWGVFWVERRRRWMVTYYRDGKERTKWYERREVAEAASRRLNGGEV